MQYSFPVTYNKTTDFW